MRDQSIIVTRPKPLISDCRPRTEIATSPAVERLRRTTIMSQESWIPALAAFLLLVLPLACAKERLDEVTIYPSTRVTIHRDSMGVPHVFAETDAGALFGAGYAMAQDRLLQIEFMVRAGRGELAEVLGPEFAEIDREVRSQSYTDAERRGFFEAEPERIRILYRSLAAGINRYVEEAMVDPGANRPFEFSVLGIPLRKFTEADLLAGGEVSARFFGGAGGNELQNQEFLRFLVEKHGAEEARSIFDDVLALEDPDAVPTVAKGGAPAASESSPREARESREAAWSRALARAERSRVVQQVPTGKQGILARIGLSRGASRTIAIAPGRSSTGEVLMMQATADGFDIHIRGETFEVAGLSFPPIGIPVMGRSSSHGWLVTTGENDVIDLFAERLDPENPKRYWHDGEWRDMEVREEVIAVDGEEPIRLEVARTVHGPVIEWDLENQTAYSKGMTIWGKELSGWAGFLGLGAARSPEEFASAVRNLPGNYNVTYGDREGRIEYWHVGRRPIRHPDVDPRLPTPGTGEYEWRGMVPFEEWPHSANPRQGYLHAWNNKPTADTRYGDSSRWGAHYRNYLPISLIESDPSIGVDDLKRFNRTIAAGFASVDLTVADHRLFLPFIEASVAENAEADLGQMASLLGDWNGLYEDADEDGWYDHPGVLFFRSWLSTAGRLVFEDDIGDWWWKLDEDLYIKYRTSLLLRALQGSEAGAPMKWDFLNGEPRDSVVRRTLRETIETLRSQQGHGDLASWRQRAFWRYFDQEAFDEADPDKPCQGDELCCVHHIPGAAVTLGYIPESIPHNGMPMWTAIMEIGDGPPSLLTAIPTGGQSWFISRWGRANPHLNDQTEMHRRFGYKRVEMDEAKILGSAESTTILDPRQP
jgi:acyl-homoserine lactone acylase PvdQ